MADMGIKLVHTNLINLAEIQATLEQKQAGLVQALRSRDDIAIEKSADQMDEIQYASERDLAIRNVDFDSGLLREVKAALRRLREGNFGLALTVIFQSVLSGSRPCPGRHVVLSARIPST